MQAEPMTVKTASKELGCHPRQLSQLLYDFDPHAATIPIIRHRRQIPVDVLPELQRQLELRGVLESPQPLV